MEIITEYWTAVLHLSFNLFPSLGLERLGGVWLQGMGSLANTALLPHLAWACLDPEALVGRVSQFWPLALCALPLPTSASASSCPSSTSPFSFFSFPPTLPAPPPLELAFGPPLAGPRTKVRMRQDLRTPCYGDKVPVQHMDCVAMVSRNIGFSLQSWQPLVPVRFVKWSSHLLGRSPGPRGEMLLAVASLAPCR